MTMGVPAQEIDPSRPQSAEHVDRSRCF